LDSQETQKENPAQKELQTKVFCHQLSGVTHYTTTG
jgi:hypothetical protein